MKIELTLCNADDIKTDLQNLRNFKNRWIEIISGWRSSNDDEEDLQRTQSLLAAEMHLENLFFALKEAETEEINHIKIAENHEN